MLPAKALADPTPDPGILRVFGGCGPEFGLFCRILRFLPLT